MFNMLDIYRSRLFNKRRKSRLAKRMSIFNRRDSMNQLPSFANISSSFAENGEANNGDPPPSGGRRFSISSSKDSFTTASAADHILQMPGQSFSMQNILSAETDRFESMINRLSLTDEDQLLSLLAEYFLSREDMSAFSCTLQASPMSLSSSKSTYSIEACQEDDLTSRMKRFSSVFGFSSLASSSSSSKKIRNRCFYASVQAHMAQAFKAMDNNFDNKLSFDEFATGVRGLLNEHAMKRVCAKSYFKFATSLVNDESCLRRLFAKLDLNNDSWIDFGEFIRNIPIPMCQNRIKVLNEAFDLLDSDEDDYLTYDDFEFWFRSYHPNFVNRPPDEQLDKFVRACMANFNGKDNTMRPISREKFFEYYKVVSSTMINDAYFALYIKRIHRIE